MKRVAICLAGNIKKGHEKINDDYWSDAELHIISHTLKPSCVDFLHPAIRTIVSTIEEGSEWIRSFMVGKEATLTIKDLESIKDAMSYYRHTQYSKDSPMLSLAKINDELYKKMHPYVVASSHKIEASDTFTH